jgi:FAD/FMN-containing dehydrogenase
MMMVMTLPSQVFHPASVEEVKRLVLRAAAMNPRPSIRVVGHGHSWSPILGDSGSAILVMDRMHGE